MYRSDLSIDAGKSTLIKMLIELAKLEQGSSDDGRTFPTPLVGLRDASEKWRPTSVDVHLYPDPETFMTKTPLLYTDCEGLDGGEELPEAARKPRHDENRRSRILGGSSRHLRWANTTETRMRSYTVAELYPRLLYTFSDVVVFVLTNPK
jgi:hypothetical protein